MNKATLLVLLGLASIATVKGEIPEDKVESLPQCGPLPSPWYSGYLKVSETKSLFYVFI